MMNQLKIRNKPGRKTLWIISIDDFDLGTLPQSVLFQYVRPSSSGIYCDNEKVDLITESIYKYTFGRILDYLARQDRSEVECKRYLQKFYISSEMIDQIIVKLKAKNYQNDTRYAETIAISASSKGWSRKELKWKMRERGLSELIVERAINEYYDDEAIDEKLYLKIQRMADRYSSLPYFKLKEKVLASFYRKGFSIDKISYLLQKYLNEDS